MDELRASMGWQPRLGDGPLVTTAPPTAGELRLIREDLDPKGVYTK
jgi:hypothetical protein